jgi:hypothetical protein
VFANVTLEGKDTDSCDRQLSLRAEKPRSPRSLSGVMSTCSVYPREHAGQRRAPYQPRVESSSSRGMPATSSPRIAGPRPALTSAITSGLSK